ncbi:MAG: NUDIX hydrolase N-terminal domain-containing protein [Anaerolineae bacterium]|nr:NUDIX hydrolase N-terminal domain-containing protein [Anaerolineae bacterium]
MNPAQRIALWADRLRDISALGLRFANNIYDRQHYQTVQDIAMAMMALATGGTMEQMEPLRAPVFARPTPLAVGDAAIIDADGQILLIRRADNGKWAMPGGALEVGETPAEGIVREAFEETGIHCQAMTLVGVFDSRLCGSTARHHLYQFLFLCQPTGREAEPISHAEEVLDVRWFPEHALPANIDPGHVTKIPRAFQAWRGDERAFFDQSA